MPPPRLPPVARDRRLRLRRATSPSRPGGSGGQFQCAYHGWRFDDGGTLKWAYCEEDFPQGSPCGKRNLVEIPCDTWAGFVFMHVTPGDAAGRPLSAQLDAVPGRVANYPLAHLRAARRIVYDVAANWKVLMENYNECYHCGPCTPSCARSSMRSRNRAAAGSTEAGVPQKEGTFTFTRTGRSDRAPFPGLSEDERTRHKGEIVYPNLAAAVGRPRGRSRSGRTARAHHHRVRLPVPS